MGSGHWGWMVGGSNLMIYHRSIHFSRPGEGTNSWTGGMMSQTEPDLLRNLSCFFYAANTPCYLLSFIKNIKK